VNVRCAGLSEGETRIRRVGNCEGREARIGTITQPIIVLLITVVILACSK
jgi:hypothetical protein